MMGGCLTCRRRVCAEPFEEPEPVPSETSSSEAPQAATSPQVTAPVIEPDLPGETRFFVSNTVSRFTRATWGRKLVRFFSRL